MKQEQKQLILGIIRFSYNMSALHDYHPQQRTGDF